MSALSLWDWVKEREIDWQYKSIKTSTTRSAYCTYFILILWINIYLWSNVDWKVSFVVSSKSISKVDQALVNLTLGDFRLIYTVPCKTHDSLSIYNNFLLWSAWCWFVVDDWYLYPNWDTPHKQDVEQKVKRLYENVLWSVIDCYWLQLHDVTAIENFHKVASRLVLLKEHLQSKSTNFVTLKKLHWCNDEY